MEGEGECQEEREGGSWRGRSHKRNKYVMCNREKVKTRYVMKYRMDYGYKKFVPLTSDDLWEKEIVSQEINSLQN